MNDYYEKRGSLFVSPSINDPMKDSAYRFGNQRRLKNNPYQDPSKMAELIGTLLVVFYAPNARWNICSLTALLFSTGLAAVYYGMVEEVDFWVGEILGALDSNGLWNNTLVILSSDHGDLLGTNRTPSILSITFSPTNVLTRLRQRHHHSSFLSQEHTR